MSLAILLSFLIMPYGDTTKVPEATRKFYEEVIGDLRFNGPFIVCEIESPGYSGMAAIEALDLYLTLKNTKHFNEKQYKEYVLKCLLSNEKIQLGLPVYNRIFPVKADEEVVRHAANGLDSFINAYIGGFGAIHAREKKGAVIEQFFRWNMKCRTDCESGYIFVPGLCGKMWEQYCTSTNQSHLPVH
jgi:hypothetical protein